MQAARAEVLGRADGANIYRRACRTRDACLSVGAISPDPARRFRDATGIEDLRSQTGISTANSEQRQEQAKLLARAEAVFASRTTAEWIAVLTRRRVPHARVNFPEQALEDPPVLANGYVTELEHELLGT